MSRQNEVCPKCQSVGYIKVDPTNGYRVCEACGAILSDSVIVNEIEFTDLSSGRTARLGNFIPSTNPISPSTVSSSSLTLSEGKNQIAVICEYLPRLTPDVVSLAQRLFCLALRERFTRGRTISIVAGASVYVAIRVKKITGYLLVDVADHIDCGIYELAATANRLAACVGYLLPVTDPILYIDRFIDALNFGNKATAIKQSATQILRRLDQDWIRSGRKPTGVCGAAILLAAKINQVPLTKEEVQNVARVCVATVNKRLREVAQTSLAEVSINDLRTDESILQSQHEPEIPPSLRVRKDLESIAAAIDAPAPEQKINDSDFSDNDLADVDQYIIGDESEVTKRKALYYTMYKSKINEPPKQTRARNPKKKRENTLKRKIINDDEPLDSQLIIDDGHDVNEADAIEGDDDFEDIDFD